MKEYVAYGFLYMYTLIVFLVCRYLVDIIMDVRPEKSYAPNLGTGTCFRIKLPHTLTTRSFLQTVTTPLPRSAVKPIIPAFLPMYSRFTPDSVHFEGKSKVSPSISKSIWHVPHNNDPPFANPASKNWLSWPRINSPECSLCNLVGNKFQRF
jgi:hypothetical protein